MIASLPRRFREPFVGLSATAVARVADARTHTGSILEELATMTTVLADTTEALRLIESGGYVEVTPIVLGFQQPTVVPATQPIERLVTDLSTEADRLRVTLEANPRVLAQRSSLTAVGRA